MLDEAAVAFNEVFGIKEENENQSEQKNLEEKPENQDTDEVQLKEETPTEQLQKTDEEQADDFLNSIMENKSSNEEESLRLKEENEKLKADLENEKKRSSDTHRDWHEMSERIKKIESLNNDVEVQEEDKEKNAPTSLLYEELPEYADAIREEIETASERIYRQREEDKKRLIEKEEERRLSQNKDLTDEHLGHPDYFEVCKTAEFDVWANAPKNSFLFKKLMEAKAKDEYSALVTRIRLRIISDFKKEQANATIAKRQKNALDTHQKKVTDMSTTVQTGQTKGSKDVKRDFKSEFEEGFFSVFN